ncbi:hypothetical protein JT359_04630 [Candidatus Poribacteria bacterium]|nr:hypothetical protein [Candidatus Poribacteria bacterium]
MKISYIDLQHIKNESSLIEFLRDKLKIPIPNGLTLENISSKYSNYALGLNDSCSKQVLDCQELSLIPGQPSGILLILFNDVSNYSGVLHAILNTLREQGKNIQDLRMICVSKNYQPFAIANLNQQNNQESSKVGLNILTWHQKNTFITSSNNHEIPDHFIYKQVDIQITAGDILLKIENVGTPLKDQCDIYKGITTGCNQAYIITDEERDKLIRKHPESKEIIKLGIGKHQQQQWKPSYKNIIWIPSRNKKWTWSNEIIESNAEIKFQETYPGIHEHLRGYIDKIKTPSKESKDLFYWELPFQEYLNQFRGPKITIYDKPPIMAFYDESDAIVINPYVHCIKTSDLSILAILNSSLFNWYLHTKFKTKGGGCLNKSNLELVPIVADFKQKQLLSDLVQQLLINIDNQSISDIENEIDLLVYKIYELTEKEINYIEDSLINLDKKNEITTSKVLPDEQDNTHNNDFDSDEYKEII